MLHSETLLAFLITVSSITVISTILYRLRLPTVVGFIGTGLAIGPYGLDWIHSIPIASLISELGVALLLFSLGLEISISKLRKMLFSLLSLGMGQVGATLVIGFILFSGVWGLPIEKGVVFGGLLALSSTAAVLKLLQDHRETETPFGQVIVHVLLFQDLAALPMMVMIPLLGGGMADGAVLKGAPTALKMVGAVGGILLAGRYLIPYVFDQVVRTGSRELFFFLIMSVALGTAFLAERSGLSISIGTFLAGVVISESPYSKQALAEMSLMRDNFLGLLFASFGMLLDTRFLVANLWAVLGLVVLFSALKGAIAYGVIRLNRRSHGVAFSGALGLAQIGEFSFILAALALSNKIIDDREFQYFLCLAVLSLLASPLLFGWARRVSGHCGWKEMLAERERGSASVSPVVDTGRSGHRRRAIVIGLGHAGQNVMESLATLGVEFIGIDFNAGSIKTLKAKGFPVMYADAAQAEILLSAGIDRAYLVIITVTGKHLTSKIMASIRMLRPDIKTIVRTQFILDLDELELHDQDQLVVAEFETSREVLAQVLIAYEVPPAQIHATLERCAHRMRELLGSVQSESLKIQGPYWTALSSIRLFSVLRVVPESKRICDLSIREKTGCNIVAIYRQGPGLHFPDATTEICGGDVLYAVGTREALNELAYYVESGFAA